MHFQKRIKYAKLRVNIINKNKNTFRKRNIDNLDYINDIVLFIKLNAKHLNNNNEFNFIIFELQNRAFFINIINENDNNNLLNDNSFISNYNYENKIRLFLLFNVNITLKLEILLYII